MSTIFVADSLASGTWLTFLVATVREGLCLIMELIIFLGNGTGF